MGQMTLTEMVSEVRYGLGNRTGVTTARIVRWLNWSLLHVSQPTVHRHIELLEDGAPVIMVAGTTNYAVPTRLIAPYQVRAQQGSGGTYYRWLEAMVPRRFDRLQPSPTPQGAPAYYTYGPTRAVRIYPAPDATWAGGDLQVRGWMRPTLFVTSSMSVTSPLADIWDEVLVMGGIWRAWTTLNVPDRAEVMGQTYAGLINEVSRVLNVAGEDDPRISVDPELTRGNMRW